MRRLTRWIRQLIRRFRKRRTHIPITVYVDGSVQVATAFATVGLKLRVLTPHGERLVADYHCQSPLDFWSVWDELNTQTLLWEDGTTFYPLSRN